MCNFDRFSQIQPHFYIAIIYICVSACVHGTNICDIRQRPMPLQCRSITHATGFKNIKLRYPDERWPSEELMYCTSASLIVVILMLHYLFILRTFLLDVFAKALNLVKLVAQVIGLGLYLISCVCHFYAHTTLLLLLTWPWFIIPRVFCLKCLYM